MDIAVLERKIEHHRSEMLRYCYRAVCIEAEPEKREKAIRSAKGHEVAFKRLIEKKKRLLAVKTNHFPAPDTPG